MDNKKTQVSGERRAQRLLGCRGNAARCRRYLFAAAVAVWSQLAGATAWPGQSDTDLHLRAAASVLAQKADPDSLAAAGLIERPFDLARSQTLIERALQAAPERPDLLWLALQVCASAPACDSAPLEARLLAAAPGNGAAYLNQMDRATTIGDPALVRQALIAFARADRVDTYWTTLNARLSRAVAAGTATPLVVAMVDVVGTLAALPAPSFLILSRSCKGVTDAAEVDRCRASATVLRQGDTILLESLGESIALRNWPDDSAEHQALQTKKIANRARDRELGLYDALLLNPRGAEKFITLLSENRREQDVFVAWNVYAKQSQKRAARAEKMTVRKSHRSDLLESL